MIDTHRFSLLTACGLLASALLVACGKPATDPAEEGKTDPGTEEKGEIEVVDGKVRFFLEYAPNSTRKALGTDVFTGCKIQVNGKDYIPNRDPNGKWVIDVNENPTGTYTAVRINAGSAEWYEDTPYRNVIVPLGQFRESPPIGNFPCYAQYKEKDGNTLLFNDAFAVLDIVVKGDATLTSIQAVALGGEALSGKGSYLPSRETFSFSINAPRAVLNCAKDGNGAKVTAEGAHFPLIVAAGKFSQGIELTLCDADRKMVRHLIPTCTLASGEVKQVTVDYTPDPDLVWYEGFDRLVWGGDLMGGSTSYGFAPDAQEIGISDGADRKGSDYALTTVPYDRPGSGFIQSNTWDDVSGKTVATSHVMSESYLKSRGLDEYMYLFRCQEYQGMMVVGAGSSARGILCTPPITNMEGFSTVKLRLRFCLHAGFTDDLLMEILNGGMLSEVKLDGRTLLSGTDRFSYGANASNWIGNRASLSVPSSLAEKKTWHEIEATIERATDGTRLYLTGNSSGTGNHGIYVDEISFTRIAGSERKGNLRVLYWNIQNGMWADQHNNYDNFVAWVKKYDPDICVWCESASIYKDKTGSSASNADRFLPNGWPALAARYGHKYTAVGGHRDNYPQTVTSKYPVTSILKITNTDVSGKPVAHGAAIQEVNVDGRKLWFVTCHMWPQGYGYGVNGDAAREASRAKNEGDYYRQFEMEYIVSHTINDPKYAAQQDWFLLGDLNSRSRLDNWFYKYAENSTLFITQDVVLQKTNLVDVIAETYPGKFMTSTMGSSRIDFVYASPSMYGKVVDAMILMDKWTSAFKSVWYPSFYDPSDHRPILIDFDTNK